MIANCNWFSSESIYQSWICNRSIIVAGVTTISSYTMFDCPHVSNCHRSIQWPWQYINYHLSVRQTSTQNWICFWRNNNLKYFWYEMKDSESWTNSHSHPFYNFSAQNVYWMMLNFTKWSDENDFKCRHLNWWNTF